MLGSWFVFGYEGFPEEDRRQFYRQRDDPCDSDEERRNHASYDGGALRCYRKVRRRRIRKIIKAKREMHQQSSNPDNDDAVPGSSSASSSECDLVSTSASSSACSPVSNVENVDGSGDVWLFSDGDDEHEKNVYQEKSCAIMPAAGEQHLSTALQQGNIVFTTATESSELAVRVMPKPFEGLIPALCMSSCAASACSSWWSCTDAGISTIGQSWALVHGGLVQSVAYGGGSRATSSASYDPTGATWAVPLEASCCGTSAAAQLPATIAAPVVSLKRWFPSDVPPERFAHCTAAIPTDVAEGALRPSTLSREFSSINGDAYVSVSLFFTFGGAAKTRVMPLGLAHEDLSGTVLSEPMLTLVVTGMPCQALHDWKQEPRRWWCTWKRLLSGTATDAADVAAPRALFGMCAALRVAAPHRPTAASCTSKSSLAAFVVYGGTDVGCEPAAALNAVQLFTVDVHERTIDVCALTCSGAPPPPRYGHTMTAVATQAVYLVHGGVGRGQCILGDTFLLHAETHLWQEVSTIAAVPHPLAGNRNAAMPPRAFHTAVSIESDEAAVLVIGGDGNCGDVWRLNLERRVWQRVAFPLLSSCLVLSSEIDGAMSAKHHHARKKRRAEDDRLPWSPTGQEAPKRPTQLYPSSSHPDELIQDALYRMHKRVRDDHSPEHSFAGLYHGLGACAVTCSGRDVLVLGGCSAALPHAHHLRASFVLPQMRTLKTQIAMWFLKRSAGVDALNDCDSETHSRRLAADAALKAWGCDGAASVL